jgi:glycosyltransferase involved in cell wall biosynthesis
MQVLMITWEYPPHVVGGLGRHVFHLSKTLATKGVAVKVLTFTDGSSAAEDRGGRVEVVRVDPYCFRYPDFISWVHGLNMLMAERSCSMDDFDIIHVHDWLSAPSSIVLKHLTRKPLIATIHSTERGRRGELRNDYERHIHELEWLLSYEAWGVICCSNYMLREVSSNLGCPQEKIKVIPNGYALSSLGPPAPINRRSYAEDNEKIVLYVGRLVHEKGPQLLVEAASKLRRGDMKFLIVGEGSMKPYLMDLSKKLGVADKVYFLGHVSDSELSALYRWAWAAVFPSLYEPFGIVALEAMGAGTPVIVSATGGLDEIVQDGQNGLKFIAGWSDSLAYNINRMLNDGELRERCIKNASQTLGRYSWGMVADETLKVYNRILSEYESGTWKPTF